MAGAGGPEGGTVHHADVDRRSAGYLQPQRLQGRVSGRDTHGFHLQSVAEEDGDSTARLLEPSVPSADGVAGEQKHAAVDCLGEECLTETEHVYPFPQQQVIHLVQMSCQRAYVKMAYF